MSKEIKSISYQRLYKLEVPNLANEVIGIIERHDPETLKIKEVYDMLLAVKPQMDALKVPEGAHYLTEEMVWIRRKLLMYASDVSHKMSIVVREAELEKAENVRIAEIFIKRHLHKLAENSNVMLSHIIDKFFMEIDQNEELENIFATLDFSSNLDILRSTHSTYKEVMKRRITSTSMLPKAKTDFIRKCVLDAVKNMFLEINLAQLKNGDIDYSPLINELNRQLDTYRVLIKIRETHNKRKAENKNEKSDEMLEPTASNEVTESTRMMMNLNEEKMNEDEVSGNIVEKEKAAAKSCKQSQLPSANSKDYESDNNLI